MSKPARSVHEQTRGRPVSLYEYRGAGQPEQSAGWERCGTYAGWNDHMRSGEPVCDACKRAHADYMREWRLRTGRVKTVRVRLTPAQFALLKGTTS